MFDKIVKLFSSNKIVVKNIKQQSKVDITNIENVNIKSSEDFQKLVSQNKVEKTELTQKDYRSKGVITGRWNYCNPFRLEKRSLYKSNSG